MPRKKKKSSKKIFQFFGNIFKWIFIVIIKAIPFVLIIALLSFGFMVVKNYLLLDPNFIITNLQITTDRDYPKEDVALRGNISSGKNIFTVDLQKIAASLRVDPRVKDVKIKKVFPHTIDISLSIREEYAYLTMPNRKSYYLIDREGYAISVQGEEEIKSEYPIIVDGATLRKRIGLGTKHFTGNIANVFFAIEYLKNEGYYSKFGVNELVVDRLNSISLIVADGYEIKLGSTRLLENMEKLAHLEKILEDEKNTRIKYVDLRFDDIIVKK